MRLQVWWRWCHLWEHLVRCMSRHHRSWLEEEPIDERRDEMRLTDLCVAGNVLFLRFSSLPSRKIILHVEAVLLLIAIARLARTGWMMVRVMMGFVRRRCVSRRTLPIRFLSLAVGVDHLDHHPCGLQVRPVQLFGNEAIDITDLCQRSRRLIAATERPPSSELMELLDGVVRRCVGQNANDGFRRDGLIPFQECWHHLFRIELLQTGQIAGNVSLSIQGTNVGIIDVGHRGVQMTFGGDIQREQGNELVGLNGTGQRSMNETFIPTDRD